MILKILGRMVEREMVTKYHQQKKKNLLKEVRRSPENFMLIAYIDEDEIVMKIRRREQ